MFSLLLLYRYKSAKRRTNLIGAHPARPIIFRADTSKHTVCMYYSPLPLFQVELLEPMCKLFFKNEVGMHRFQKTVVLKQVCFPEGKQNQFEFTLTVNFTSSTTSPFLPPCSSNIHLLALLCPPQSPPGFKSQFLHKNTGCPKKVPDRIF